ncbi:MAG: hypothetical protein PW843_01675 [Azospirillaceae bacterium]|nr:hypothetical protein [Azospirillaceae bacterium]
MPLVMMQLAMGPARAAIFGPATPAAAEQAATAWLDQVDTALDIHACDLADRVCALGLHSLAWSAVGLASAYPDCPGDKGCLADRAAAAARIKARAQAVDTRLDVVRDDFSIPYTMEHRHLPPTAATVDDLSRQVMADVQASTCPATQAACVAGELVALHEVLLLANRQPVCQALPAADQAPCLKAKAQRVKDVAALAHDRLLRLFDRLGAWPAAADWGLRADIAAGTLLQMMATDGVLAAKALPLAQAAAEAGRSPGAGYALLHDRLALATNTVQLYGTQGACDEISHTWHAYTLADPGQLDGRRAALGLEPATAYQARMDAGCKGMGSAPVKADAAPVAQ